MNLIQPTIYDTNLTLTTDTTTENNLTINATDSDINGRTKTSNFEYFNPIQNNNKIIRKNSTKSEPQILLNHPPRRTLSSFKLTKFQRCKYKLFDWENQKECISIIKACLTEAGVSLRELIDDKVVIGKGEEGNEYEVIMIEDLMPLLSTAAGSNIGPENLADLEDLFRSFTNNKENYVIVQILMELFGEGDNDEEILEGINKLTDESFMIIAGLIQYLQETDTNLLDLLKSIIYQQNISIGEENVTVELIDSKDF